MASTAPSTPGTKRCPGFAGGDPAILPHEAPADLEHFNSNKGGKDGLSTRCRDCGNRYGKAWSAAKKRGEQFSVKAAPAITVEVSGAPLEPTTSMAPIVLQPAVTVPFDDLAARAERGEAEGYTAETVDGVIYALPINGSASTDEGQAALAAVNEARAKARRAADAQRKREQRAAAKARENRPS